MVANTCEHSITHRLVKLLCCTPETKITLCQLSFNNKIKVGRELLLNANLKMTYCTLCPGDTK